MYYNTVPQATQRISASQPQIQSNFGELDVDFARNHVSLINAQAADRGKHDVVQFVTQTPASNPVVGADEITLYNKIPLSPPFPGPIAHYQELFIKRAGGSPLDVPITAKPVYAAPGSSLGAQYNWFYLPCGLLVIYGQNTLDNTTAKTINFAGIGGNFTAVPFVYATPGGQTTGPAAPPPVHLNVSDVKVSSFTIVKDNAATTQVTFNWFAIGPV